MVTWPKGSVTNCFHNNICESVMYTSTLRMLNIMCACGSDEYENQIYFADGYKNKLEKFLIFFPSWAINSLFRLFMENVSFFPFSEYRCTYLYTFLILLNTYFPILPFSVALPRSLARPLCLCFNGASWFSILFN